MTKLGTEKVGSLLLRLSIPAIIAQVVNLLYNIIDRIYIGRMDDGELAIAGVGVAFPIIILIGAFSQLFGMGGAPRCSMKLGAKDKEGAEEVMTASFTMLVVVSILITTIFSIFAEPILFMFGASEATITYATDYLGIYLWGTIFSLIAIGMNPFINTQGFARTSMATILLGAIINIVLDPIFIFTLDMGVKGAAYATVISQAVSAIWVILFLRFKSDALKLRRRFIIPKWSVVWSIISLGIAPFIMQSTESLVLISLNTQLLRYGGDLAVGSMTILMSLLQMATMPLQGISQGLQPIVSYNFGAGNLKRVRRCIRLALISGGSYIFILCTALMIFPSGFVKIFTTDSQLIEMTATFIPIYFFGVYLFGLQIICQQVFVSLGQAKISLFIAILRKIVLLVPLIYVLPNFFEDKQFGVIIAEPISDMTSAITAITIFIIFYKKRLH